MKALIAGLTLALATTWAGASHANLALEPDEDVVKLTDGRELTGTIVREKDGYVWLDMGVGQPLFLSPDKIKEIVRSSDEVVGEEAIEIDDDQKTWVDDPNVTRAAIITAEGMVGMQMASKPLREAIPMLKDEGVELVVFKVNSGGGLGVEVQKLSDVLEEEYKPNFQLVGWIESAISAAAMTAITIEDLYFMPRGNFGACTGFRGALDEVEGRELEAMLYQMEKISARGNKHPDIMRAMQILEPLSYDVDEETGKVTFYRNLSGEYVLNDSTYILTLNAQQAVHSGFSEGTVATFEELQAVLEQSVGEIEWVGEKVEGIPYPVSEAEKHMLKYREEVDYQEKRWQEVMVKYMMELQNAQGVAVDRRGGFLRRAEGYLARIKRMLAINPNFGILYVGEEWVRQQEEIIRELRRG